MSARGIEAQLFLGDDFFAGDRFDVFEAQRRSEENARRRSAAGDLADREELFARERIMRLDMRGAAVRQQKFAGFSARFGDSIRKGGGEMAPAMFDLAFRRAGLGARLFQEALHELSRIFRPLRAILAKALDPRREIGAIAAEATLGQEHGDFSREPRFARGARIDDHPREPRRQREAADRAAFIRQAALGVDRTEGHEKIFGLIERGLRRRIEKGEVARRLPRAPGGAIEKKAGEIAVQNLRRCEGFKRAGRGFFPKPIAKAWFQAPGTAASLIGGGAGDAHGLQPRQAAVRLVARHAGETGIDDDPHAFDGERGFGDRRGEHDFPAARLGRRDGAFLRRAVERPNRAAQFRSRDL